MYLYLKSIGLWIFFRLMANSPLNTSRRKNNRPSIVNAIILWVSEEICNTISGERGELLRKLEDNNFLSLSLYSIKSLRWKKLTKTFLICNSLRFPLSRYISVFDFWTRSVSCCFESLFSLFLVLWRHKLFAQNAHHWNWSGAKI